MDLFDSTGFQSLWMKITAEDVFAVDDCFGFSFSLISESCKTALFLLSSGFADVCFRSIENKTHHPKSKCLLMSILSLFCG